MKGQAAVELVVILAVSLLVLFVIISISNDYITQLGSSKITTQARNSVDDLASAARQVYHQGEGARQQVLVTIPEGEDSSRSGVGNRTIRMNVLGSDIVATTDFEVRGRLPTKPGGYNVWVIAKKGYVLIGTLSLSADPGSVYAHFFSKNQSQTSQSGVTFINGGDSPILVNLTLNFPIGKVNVSLHNPSDAGFSLPSGGTWPVLLDLSVSDNAFGTYSGYLYANASNGDELIIDIIVDVTSLVCTNQTCPQCAGTTCTAKYSVIETFNDSTYINFKDIFEGSEPVTISGAGWQSSSKVTLDIKGPSGSSLPGYPRVVDTDSEGDFSIQWSPAGAMNGIYSVFTNDSVNQRSTSFNITKCT